MPPNTLKKKRCVSKCKGFERAECNLPRCSYVSGQTRRYCRLSSKYQMHPPTCRVSRRIKKKDRVAHATKRISQFLRSSRWFLQTVCSESGQCLVFGRYAKEITNFFKGFSNFDYAERYCERLGAVSVNGFVVEISFQRKEYMICTILKSSQKPSADNLFYEYLVGTKYINRQLSKFPCFVQTYGLYYYDTPENWLKTKDAKRISTDELASRLIPITTMDYRRACTMSKYLAVLVQHVQGSSLGDKLKKSKRFVENQLIYVLFIIYHALSSLSKTFTHYDLHEENVLLYELPADQYVEYHYHLSARPASVITFRLSCVPKLIDYGRSFFDNGNSKSSQIYRQLTQIKECEPRAGEQMGFTWLNPTTTAYGICSSNKNESHDLRLLARIYSQSHLRSLSMQGLTDGVLKKVVYGVKSAVPLAGTEENLHTVPNKITNVTQAFHALCELVENPRNQTTNVARYADTTKTKFSKLGDFHIYDDGRAMTLEKMLK